MHDLHIHLGGAVPSAVLWETLGDNGLQTEFDNFTRFHDSLQDAFRHGFSHPSSSVGHSARSPLSPTFMP